MTGTQPSTRWTAAILFALACCVGACGAERPRDPADVRRDADAGDVPEPDAGDADLDAADGADVDPDASEATICSPCTASGECSEPGARCVTLPDGNGYCGADCSADGGACPDGTICFDTDVEGVRQCLPEGLACVDRCGDVVCGDAERCDPATGACVAPGALCAPCVEDAQCGGADDRCVALAGPDCDDDGDCPGGRCGPAGACLSGYCGVSCAEGCPEGTLCFEVGASTQCLPTDLACGDLCAEVDCAPGFNCDPMTGGCVRVELGSCGGPCTRNATCGGAGDLCLDFGEGPVCTLACGEGAPPCPLGTACVDAAGGRFCVSTEPGASCGACATLSCPAGDACRPFDGACYPVPTPCASDADCAGGACNVFEGRCEPLGLSCDYARRFDACDLSSAVCSASAPGRAGACEARCLADHMCAPDRPRCVVFHGVASAYCASDVAGGAHTCGREQPADAPLGRPCDPEAPLDEACPADVTDVCLDPGDASVDAFCTAACSGPEACPSGSACVPFDGGSFCVPSACSCLSPWPLEPNLGALLDSALSEVGATRCALAWPLDLRRAVFGLGGSDDPYRLGGTAGWFGEPHRAIADLWSAAASISGDGALRALAALDVAGQMAGLERASYAPASTLGAEPLYAALSLLAEARGGPGPSAEERAAAGALPDAVELAVGRLVADLTSALDAMAPALAGVTPEQRAALEVELLNLLAGGGAERSLLSPDVRQIIASRERRQALHDAAVQVVGALAQLPSSFGPSSDPFFARFETAAGAVVVAGGGADTHRGPALLRFDLGGDDTYEGAVASSAAAGRLGVVVDLGGADTYRYDTVEPPRADGLLRADAAGRAAPAADRGAVSLSTEARQGAGVFGVGVLLDRGEGHDAFATLRAGQGFGMFGVGVLVDVGGSAELAAEALAQGAAAFGAGVLVTGDAGNVLEGAHGVQGFGGPAGVGLLVGGDGVDVYRASVAAPLYRDATLADDANVSLAQGAAAGLDGVSGTVSGGLGWIIERGGDDRYVADVAAQGFGARYGAGAITDLDGGDRYEGGGQIGGVGVDRGVGTLVDAAGDDIYGGAARPSASFGAGTNFGSGAVVDLAGNDEVIAGDDAIGFGAENGGGAWLDASGDDTYAARSGLGALGEVTSDGGRGRAATWGLMIDAAGGDSYAVPAVPSASDGASWGAPPSAAPAFGVGRDGE